MSINYTISFWKIINYKVKCDTSFSKCNAQKMNNTALYVFLRTYRKCGSRKNKTDVFALLAKWFILFCQTRNKNQSTT